MSNKRLSEGEDIALVESIRDGIYQSMDKAAARTLRYKPSRKRNSRRAYKYFRRGLRLLSTDSSNAIAYIVLAARAGYADAQCVLGNIMASSIRLFPHPWMAAEVLRGAVAQGHAIAMVALADIIKAESPVEAFNLCRRAAARDVRALPYLAKMYLRGIGTEKDADRARALLEQAWRKSPCAATMLALMLRDSDPARSDALLHDAANRGDAGACYHLACQTEFPESHIWGAIACRLGNIDIMLKYAEVHYTPEMFYGTTPEYKEGMKTYCSAAWEYLIPAARMGSERAEQLIDELRKDDIPRNEPSTSIIIDPQTLRPVISVTPTVDECIEYAIQDYLEDNPDGRIVFK